jgi:Family of unknown function (DUF5329)
MSPWARPALLALALLPAVCVAELTAASKKEIDGLLHAVGSSGCEFMRGGSPHSAAKAQEHLLMKYKYLAARDQVKSAEEFIVKAATRSSMTGQAYGIRCGGAPALDSADWMTAQLKMIRQAPAK